jgi:glycosyltransferase involved in cell wall biosynthesis
LTEGARRSFDQQRFFFIGTASLLHLRGVERWLIEVASRFRNSTILTLSIGLHNIENIEEKKNEIKVLLKKIKRRNVEWHELRALSLSDENMSKIVPKPIARFIKHSGIVMPLDLRILRLRRGIVYLVVGDFYTAVLLSTILIACGVRKVILGFHARPYIKRSAYVKPILTLMTKLSLLKGIHTVNIVDALMIRGVLHNIPVWWIPNGVNCEQFKPSIKRSDKFQVLFVGALIEEKGVDTFIEAAKIVKSTYNDVEFLVASVGGSLKSLVEGAHRDGVVTFLGFVPDDELAKLYAESHVVVLPSREEAFNLISLEAQASGTPVIATDLPAFRQSVVNNMIGWLVKPYSPQVFAEAIIKIRSMWLNDRQKYERMCVAARRNAERYCWERIVKIYYKKLFK